jgi:hypothetical protein
VQAVSLEKPSLVYHPYISSFTQCHFDNLIHLTGYAWNPNWVSELDFNSASSLKQQSEDRWVALLEHIILIPNQSVFANHYTRPYNFVTFYLSISSSSFGNRSNRTQVKSSPGQIGPRSNRIILWSCESTGR